MASERTVSLKKKRNIFFIISMVLWIGTALFYAFTAFSRGIGSTDGETIDYLSESARSAILSLSTTVIVALILTIIIKDKVRTCIWMLNVILGAILFGNVAMYITFALWFIDEYIIRALYLKYKNGVQINKEIDIREGM